MSYLQEKRSESLVFVVEGVVEWRKKMTIVECLAVVVEMVVVLVRACV